MASRAGKSKDQAYMRYKEILRIIKNTCGNADTALAGDTNANQICSWKYGLKRLRKEMNVLRQTPGIVQYARDQEEDLPDYDVVAEYLALNPAIENVITWVDTYIPTNAEGYVLGWKSGDDDLIPRTFAPAVTADLRTNIQALAAEITI